METIKKDILREISINQIDESPYQGRLITDSERDAKDSPNKIDSLARSIEKNGLMTPIIVRQKGSRMYELIDGHRRLLAYRKLGIGKIKAIIKDYDDRLTQVFSIIGNLDRKNLTKIELAIAYQKILDQKIYRNRIELSEALGRDKTYVGDLLNLLKLDSRIIEDLAQNNSIRDVRLLRIIRRYDMTDEKGVSDKQWDLYRKIVSEKLSRKDVVQIISRQKQPVVKKSDTIKTKGSSEIPFDLKIAGDNINLQLNVNNIDKKKQELIFTSIGEYIRDLLEKI